MLKFAGSAGRRVFSSSLLCATAIGLATAVATPAFAQDDPADAADDNVIIVTAQLRGQDVQDVPLSITAVSGEMLEARSQTNLTQIANQTPNLLLQQNPSG